MNTEIIETLNAIVAGDIPLEESMSALELALENMDWRLLTHHAQQEFTRPGLKIITEMARIYFLKNPLIKRSILVQMLYVWGQGMQVKSATPEIQDAINAFNDDKKNRAELTSHQARGQKEIELQTDGNLFLVAFPNITTGRVRFRSIDFNEIENIIRNPDDSKEPWYYLRVWTETTTQTQTGAMEQVTRHAYYPDWEYNPIAKPTEIGPYPVLWKSPVYHIKTGGFSHWAFGISEIYAAIDWSKAYKEFLEDWASIVRAYRRFAFSLQTPGGKPGIQAAKTKLNTTMATGGTSIESNPSPVTGATFISGPDAKLEPIRTAGATVSAEDGRRILLMVCAATGLPETFFGDVSTGAHATAKTMDRPTELMMVERQNLWRDIFTAIYNYVLLWAVKAPQGALRAFGDVTVERDDGQIVERVVWHDDVDSTLSLTFAPILEQDVATSVNAIVNAATLGGHPPVGTVDLPTLARMLLTALGENNVDEAIDRMFPDGDVTEMLAQMQKMQPKPPEPKAPPANQDGQSQPGQDKQPVDPKQENVKPSEAAAMLEAAARIRIAQEILEAA